MGFIRRSVRIQRGKNMKKITIELTAKEFFAIADCLGDAAQLHADFLMHDGWEDGGLDKINIERVKRDQKNKQKTLKMFLDKRVK